MSTSPDLLNTAFFVAIYATAFGACYQMLIEPGEVLSFIPRHFYYKKSGSFLIKVSACGKCVAGWIAIFSTWFWCPVSLINILFTTALATALSIVFTGLINVYVQNRS